MARYEEVKYSKSQIKKAGKKYVAPDTDEIEKNEALEVINNWRSAHSFPLQVIYMHIQRIAPPNAIVAQRLKRLYSITQKLFRFPNMSLTAMQDIGGCRVIVESISQVYEMVDHLTKSRMRHRKKEEYDYIAHPKPDGYRSFHIVYLYFSDRNPKYNGLFIEIQIRTHIQHIWATAIEMMDTFTGNPLKIGQGDPKNRQFFVLASKLLEIYEKSDCSIDSVKSSQEVINFIEYDQEHQILNRLRSIKAAVEYVRSVESLEQGYYLLRLNRKNNQLVINNFRKSELEQATAQYDIAEKTRDIDEDVVLVSTSSYKTLKQAYPNYFSDIAEFITLMEKFIL